MVKFDILTFTLRGSSKIRQMKPSKIKLCCLIGLMITMGIISLCISLPNRGHPEVIQKYLIPIYQVGNQCMSQIDIVSSNQSHCKEYLDFFAEAVHTRVISLWASKGLNMLTWEKCRYFLSMSSSKIVMEPKTIAVALKMSFMRKSITWKNKSSSLYVICRCHFQIFAAGANRSLQQLIM